MRRLLILGSTGSIGTQALEVAAESDALRVVGLAAGASSDELAAQAERLALGRIALRDEDAASRARESWGGEVLQGEEGVLRLIGETDCDLVLNALVGSAGLSSTVATLSEGMDLALANKESLVVGGDLVTALAEGTGARIIPVDSEHSALLQLIGAEPPGNIERLVLTASGGPFRGWCSGDLAGVSADQALAHPTWDMGGKISVDSATLMNKGLELIEAHHLFGVPYERIDVLVHPQSLVHALVHLNDGASLAHMGHPDMRVPISYALHFPERHDVPVDTLDLAAAGELTFEQPDIDTFPSLRLAREAGLAGGTAPCVLNAANEVAARAFLEGELAFTGIPEVIEDSLDAFPPIPEEDFNHLLAVDAQARERARAAVRGVAA